MIQKRSRGLVRGTQAEKPTRLLSLYDEMLNKSYSPFVVLSINGRLNNPHSGSPSPMPMKDQLVPIQSLS